MTALAVLVGGFIQAAHNWKTYFKNTQIEIQYCYTECHDETNGIHQQKILLRFVNLTNTKTEVSFQKELTYSPAVSVSSEAKTYTVSLSPLEQKEGNCSLKENALYIYSKQLNFESRQLTHFDLKNISVKNIE